MSTTADWTDESRAVHRALAHETSARESEPDIQVVELIRLAVCGHELSVDEETRVFKWLLDQIGG
jgi:hypothetical protein